jgi:hypothetical protein
LTLSLAALVDQTAEIVELQGDSGVTSQLRTASRDNHPADVAGNQLLRVLGTTEVT